VEADELQQQGGEGSTWVVAGGSAPGRRQAPGEGREMKIIDRLNRANLSFGLREALVLALAGIAIGSAVAYHYAG
jgi:hypothetical protein